MTYQGKYANHASGLDSVPRVKTLINMFVQDMNVKGKKQNSGWGQKDMTQVTY